MDGKGEILYNIVKVNRFAKEQAIFTSITGMNADGSEKEIEYDTDKPQCTYGH